MEALGRGVTQSSLICQRFQGQQLFREGRALIQIGLKG